MLFYDIFKKIFCALLMLFLMPSLIKSIIYQYRTLYEPKTRIGVIYFPPFIAQSALYHEQLYRFFRDPDIHGLLLYIPDSTGLIGTAQTLAHTIIALKKEHVKPVIAFIENKCHSSPYLIACAADYIVAAGTALISPLENNCAAITKEYDPSSEHDCTIEYKKNIREQVISFITQQRKLPFSLVSEQNSTHFLTGIQAKKVGFIDDNGGIQKVYAGFMQKTLIQGSIEWISYDNYFSSWLSRILITLFPLTHPSTYAPGTRESDPQ